MPHDDEALKARIKKIFDAGAEALTPSIPTFDGRPLGSMERCNWYDGYASTHPEFKNPYRQLT